MENILSFLADHILFLILVDSVFVLALFYSFVANKRQGFHGIDLDPMIYFSLIKYLALVSESYLYNYRSEILSYFIFIYLSLNILSYFFLLVFGYRIKPFSQYEYTIYGLVLLVPATIIFFSLGAVSALFSVYVAFAISSYWLAASRMRSVLWGDTSDYIKNALYFVPIVAVSDSIVPLWEYFYFYQGMCGGCLAASIFLRALVAGVFAISIFWVYIHNHEAGADPSLSAYRKDYGRFVKNSLFLMFSVLFIFSYFALAYYKNESITSIRENATQHLITSSVLLKERIDTAEALALSLSGSPIFEQGIVADARTSAALDRYSMVLAGLTVYIMDKDGNVVDSSNRSEPDSFVGKNYSQRPYFTKAISGLHGEDHDFVAVGLTSAIPGYYVGSPIDTVSGERVGVVVVKLNIEEIPGINQEEIDCFFLSDEDGVIVSSDCKEFVFGGLYPIDRGVAISKVAQAQYPEIRATSILNNKHDLKSEKIVFYQNRDILVITDKIDGPLYEGVIIKNPETKNGIYLVFFVLISGSFFVLVVFFNRVLDHQNTESVEKREKIALDARKDVESEKKELERMNRFMIGRELKMVELKKEIKELKDRLENKS